MQEGRQPARIFFAFEGVFRTMITNKQTHSASTVPMPAPVVSFWLVSLMVSPDGVTNGQNLPSFKVVRWLSAHCHCLSLLEPFGHTF